MKFKFCSFKKGLLLGFKDCFLISEVLIQKGRGSEKLNERAKQVLIKNGYAHLDLLGWISKISKKWDCKGLLFK